MGKVKKLGLMKGKEDTIMGKTWLATTTSPGARLSQGQFHVSPPGTSH
jgi:hypothetical protein